jgi:hypothetical protein
MRSLYFLTSFLLLLLISTQSHAYGYVASSKKSGYLEIGFGATQFEFTDKYLADYEIAPSPSIKLVYGGRIGRSQFTWFVFNYTNNGAFKTEDSTTVNDEVNTFRSQSIAMGLKLTTAPFKKASAYARLGAGRIMLEEREESFTSNTSNLISNEYNTTLSNHAYLGLGANFSISRNARLGIEAQQMQYKIQELSLADTTVMLTFTRYLK